MHARKAVSTANYPEHARVFFAMSVAMLEDCDTCQQILVKGRHAGTGGELKKGLADAIGLAQSKLISGHKFGQTSIFSSSCSTSILLASH